MARKTQPILVVSLLVLTALLLGGCAKTTPAAPAASPAVSVTAIPSALPATGVPNFSHIIVIFLENTESTHVIGNDQMPNFNRYARENSLLGEYYGIRHPSLPNYLALVGGDTRGVDNDRPRQIFDGPTLVDELEKKGLTWKTYQESMPEACHTVDAYPYMVKHNPFVFFESVVQNQARCQQSVVPLDQLEADLKAGVLPNFAFITPNMCNIGHDCDLATADRWLGVWVPKLLANPEIARSGLIVLTWDEGGTDKSCCGLDTGGGHIATVLISPYARAGFTDSTAYTHYSLLRTICTAWGIAPFGLAADPNAALITAPWK